MSITVTTTRITRQYLERKTKSDLAQMYMELLTEMERLESAVRQVIEWEKNYREINHLGNVAPECFQRLIKIVVKD